MRDFLLGREPQDFDIATDARPEQVAPGPCPCHGAAGAVDAASAEKLPGLVEVENDHFVACFGAARHGCAA